MCRQASGSDVTLAHIDSHFWCAGAFTVNSLLGMICDVTLWLATVSLQAIQCYIPMCSTDIIFRQRSLAMTVTTWGCSPALFVFKFSMSAIFTLASALSRRHRALAVP